MPQSLDEAMLRPGRIDRIYKVGYPSKEGRKATYDYYFAKVQHDLTPADIDKLATMTPYATGASIQDMVNEALVIAIRDGREVINWADVTRAKQLKEHGLPDDSEYVEPRATRGGDPRGVPRRGRLPHPQAHGDRHGDDRAPRRHRRVRVVDPARGPVRPVALRARRRHHREPGVARRGTPVLRRRQLRRGRRGHARRDGGRRLDARATGPWATRLPPTASRSSRSPAAAWGRPRTARIGTSSRATSASGSRPSSRSCWRSPRSSSRRIATRSWRSRTRWRPTRRSPATTSRPSSRARRGRSWTAGRIRMRGSPRRWSDTTRRRSRRTARTPGSTCRCPSPRWSAPPGRAPTATGTAAFSLCRSLPQRPDIEPELSSDRGRPSRRSRPRVS